MRILKPAQLGKLAHFVSQLLIKTVKVKMTMDPDYHPKNQYVYGFWHDKHIVPVLLVSKYSERYAGLVSNSRDGEILATWLKRLGYVVIRGSSSRKAISSFLKLLGIIKDGYSVGIAADGPRGPRHEAKSGAAFLAYKSGIPFVPLGVANASAWCFDKSWDKYQFPRPFSRSAIYFGKPMMIENLDDQAALNERIAQAITQADEQAKKILMGSCNESFIGYPEEA
jgi:lysophospholipid acyltransferase (LPLAT)-like uncharacterized protein